MTAVSGQAVTTRPGTQFPLGAMIADVIRRRHGAVDPIGDVIRRIGAEGER